MLGAIAVAVVGYSTMFEKLYTTLLSLVPSHRKTVAGESEHYFLPSSAPCLSYSLTNLSTLVSFPSFYFLLLKEKSSNGCCLEIPYLPSPKPCPFLSLLFLPPSLLKPGV